MRLAILLLFGIGIIIIIFQAIFGLFVDIINEFGWILGIPIIVAFFGCLGSKIK